MRHPRLPTKRGGRRSDSDVDAGDRQALKFRKQALANALFEPDGTPTLAMTEADLDELFAPE